MKNHVPRRGSIEREDHLLGLSSLVVVLSLAFIWKNPDPPTNSIPEVIIPLGISLGLGLYTFRLRSRDSSADRLEPAVKCAWAGAVFSGAVGGFWLALHYYYGLPIDVLPDKILTILSLGIAAGVLVGRAPSLIQSQPLGIDRNQLLAEATWTTQSGPTPIASAIIEALAEIEGVDPLDLEPLYTHVDPDILSEMRSHDGAPWQFTIYTDEYEIRISSHGTVSVYQNDQ